MCDGNSREPCRTHPMAPGRSSSPPARGPPGVTGMRPAQRLQPLAPDPHICKPHRYHVCTHAKHCHRCMVAILRDRTTATLSHPPLYRIVLLVPAFRLRHGHQDASPHVRSCCCYRAWHPTRTSARHTLPVCTHANTASRMRPTRSGPALSAGTRLSIMSVW
jgi:hypothetical protein